MHEILVDAENKKEAESTKNAWPAFVWTVLKNRKVHEIYGESICQFIPQQWRYWWIETLKTKYLHVFGEVTIENQPPIFVDRTPELSELER